MNQKNELGKGLKALLGNIQKADSTKTSSGQNISSTIETNNIPIEWISANAGQPRNFFDQEGLEELASSIKTYGIIQPLTLRKKADKQFEIISGERRYRAAKIVGLKEVPAYVRDADDTQMLEMALVENIQREDLTPIEIAITYQRLIDECKITQESLSERVGKKRSTISNYTRLLKLPPEIQNAVREKKLSMGHARILAGIENPLQQITLYKDIISKDLSVRDAEKIASGFQSAKGRIKISASKSPVSDLQSIERRLSETLGTKVNLLRKSNGQGQIVIKFNSDQELNAILDSIIEN